MKIKFYNSLIFRLTISFVVLITVITGSTYLYTYNQAKKALKDTVKNQLAEVVEISSLQFTPEQITLLSTIQKGDDQNQLLAEINSKLYNVRKNNKDLNELYIMRKDADKVVFVADDWIVSKSREEDPNPTKIGDEYNDYETVLLNAFSGQRVVSDDFYTDEWGTWLSGYMPLKNEANEVVAVLGVDMDVSVVQSRINFISYLIYFVIGIAILAAGLIILFFSMTITRHLTLLTRAANKFSAGDLDVTLPEIKSKNEIFFLADGMKSLITAIEYLRDRIK